MANDKDFKVVTSIKPKRYLEALGTISSNDTSFDLANTSFSNKSLDTSGQISGERGVALSADGTKIFVVDGASGDDINEYALSTAFDLSTASFTDSFSLSSQDTSPHSVHFKPDGTSFFISGRINEDIFQYDMTSAFDVSTASYANKSFAQAQDTNITGVTFSTDGTKMYIAGITNSAVFQYSLSSAFDVSTASYDSVSLDLSGQGGTPFDITFNNDGTKLFVLDNTEFIFQYNLSTAFNLSTASYSNISHQITEDTFSNFGLAFSADGTKMYVAGAQQSKVHQYSTSVAIDTLDLSTGSVFNYTPTASKKIQISNPAASGTNSGATLLLNGAHLNAWDITAVAHTTNTLDVSGQEAEMEGIHVKPDGTRIYGVGYSGDTVEEYHMSTPFDLSTATHNSTFSISAQTGTPTSIFFKPDGSKMFVLDFTGDDVNEYTLSTEWSISSASFVDSFSVNSQESTPRGLAFKTDGLVMYVVGNGEIVFQYTLTAAWDVSSASYANISYDVSSQTSSARGIAFKSDGTKMYVVGSDQDHVFEYDLSTPWTVSSAVYNNNNYTIGSPVGGSPNEITWGPDGDVFYLAYPGDDLIQQYSVGSTATTTYDSSIKFSLGTAPTSPPTGETDVITFDTTDGGTTYLASHAIDGAK